jgi:hypothetical protein
MAFSLLLAGCSDDAAEPKPLPSASGTPNSLRSDEATDAMPPKASPVTASSAEAFVRYYIETFNRASATGRTTKLEAMGDDSCRPCANVVSRIRNVYDAGGSVRSTGWVIRDLSAKRKGKLFIVVADIALPAQMVTSAAKAKPETYMGGHLRATYRLAPRTNGWRVLNLERAA